MTTCILTANTLSSLGYGKVGIGKKHYLAHRLAYCAHKNISIDSIAGLIVRHTCDTPACVNPDHLVLGTQKDNMQDKVAKGRWKGPAKKLTAEQVTEILVSSESQDNIAKKYSVSRFTVARLKKFGGYKT